MFFDIFALLFLLLASLIAAQQTPTPTIVAPTTAAPSATAASTAHGYAYAGCWNETNHLANTGGQRALSNGNSSANNTMTLDSCILFCNTYTMQYAGLEYGRECYCAQYLSAFSTRLADSRCGYACDGNASQLCGGALAISLYNRTGGAHTGGVAGSLVGGGGGAHGAAALWGFAGLGMLLVAGVL
ncbi:Hypothetical predicted protein [Lecanosticta acicola]|uniref:WSC domain-containing protein n=1 Tax=Lecanosticta acicola TaxID=111012 RepID=A0AAI8YV32_9PEZI|nr:Hypothetical predicted protein [Lecanosticta acicola]